MNFKKVRAMALATTMMVAALGSTSAFAQDGNKCFPHPNPNPTPAPASENKQDLKWDGSNNHQTEDKVSGDVEVKSVITRNAFVMTIPSKVAVSEDADENFKVKIKGDTTHPIYVDNKVDVTITPSDMQKAGNWLNKETPKVAIRQGSKISFSDNNSLRAGQEKDVTAYIENAHSNLINKGTYNGTIKFDAKVVAKTGR